MSTHYSEDEVVAIVATLTRKQLVSFVRAEIVLPLQSEAGPRFRQMDIARIELCCELCDQFQLQDEALGMVLSLVDQLHGVRAELRTVLEAIEAEKSDVRTRIGEVLFQARSGG